MSKIYILLATIINLVNGTSIYSQQVADSLYNPDIESKMYLDKNATVIHIDAAHNNFHTKDGRYFSCAQLLKSDGYRVEDNSSKFNKNSLKDIKILIIANAQSDTVTNPIVTPTQGAFTKKEIKDLKEWLINGGSLFLIADHMPFAGASLELAKEFGFHFYDSFVMNETENGTIDFSLEKKTLANNFITSGRNSDEKVTNIMTFTGQGFRIPTKATSILNLDESQTVFMVDTMWVFNDNVKRFSAKGLSQGAVMEFGKGKVAVFGEAAMFSAQLAGPRRRKAGMNTEGAKENYKLLLNIIHWLDDKLEKEN